LEEEAFDKPTSFLAADDFFGEDFVLLTALLADFPLEEAALMLLFLAEDLLLFLLDFALLLPDFDEAVLRLDIAMIILHNKSCKRKTGHEARFSISVATD